MTVSSFLNAVLVDEIGIESLRIEDCLLRSAYQPVFSRDGRRLQIRAMSAVTMVERQGRLAPLSDDVTRGFHSTAPEELIGLCQQLHLSNHRNLAMPDCDLFIAHQLANSGQLTSALHLAADRARDAGEVPLEAKQVVCRIDMHDAVSASRRRVALEALSRDGFRVAFDVFDGAAETNGFRPDISEISSVWLAKIASETAAARLLAPLMEAHRREGVGVMVSGIATSDDLRLAVTTGADYLAGDYLAPAELVGSYVEEEPKDLRDLLPAGIGLMSKSGRR
ncbi:MAG: EAL domain-containing protein [Rhizobiaceae bacterium]|nr:EAL domain-containing protein [Rhizobiaceae bacterium]